MDAKTADILKEKARQAAKRAYCPYSGYAVGAAVLADDGRIYAGCNVENASYSLTMCAERVALFKAVSDGAKKITAVCVYSEGGRMPYPCGACRQALNEFSEGLEVLVSDGKEDVAATLSELLPHGF